jgi:hypothetical protein
VKVGFKRGRHWYAPLVRAFTHSDFSHVAAAINGRLYESVALKGDKGKSGVRDYDLTPEVASEYEWIDLGAAIDGDALQRYMHVYGHSYDFFSLLAFIPLIRARDSKCEYCFELVAIMLGMEINGRVNAENILFHLAKIRA